MTTSRTLHVLAAFLLVPALAACGGSADGSAAASDAGGAAAAPAVTIDDMAFSPADLTVAVGTEVTWSNDDDAPHTVTFDGDAPDSSGQLETGDTYSVTFEQAGTYRYICAIHPDMTATVSVS